MVITRQAGKPNNNTTGGVGDIYIDITTGKQYKCTFAYRSSSGDVQKNWRPFEGHVGVDVAQVPEVPEVPTISEEVVEPTESKDYEVPVIPELPIGKKAEQTETTNRTRYSDYSKQNKR